MSGKPNLTKEKFKEDLVEFVTHKILKEVKFSACFEGIPITETRLHRIQSLIDESVITAFSDECSELFTDAEVAKKLNILRSIKPTPDLNWRPPGDPITHLRCIRAQCKRRQLEELRVLVNIVSQKIFKLKLKLTPFLESIDSLLMKQEEIEKVTASAQTTALNNQVLIEDVHSDLAQSFELLYGYK